MSGKVCILFGAGAESCLNLPNGGEFAKEVIGKNERINDAIYEYYFDKFNKLADVWYPNINKKDCKYNESAFYKACIKKMFLTENKIFNTKESFDNEVKCESDKLKNDKDKAKDIIEKHTSYMGVFDEKFHTLISPKNLGPQNFWDVIFAYSRAYLSIASKIVYESKQPEKDDYKVLLEKPRIVADSIETFCDRFKGESYYRLTNPNDCCIITTNYSSIIKRMTGISDENIAFIHGNLELFESAKTLSVIHYTNEDYEKDLYFPFLAIQSGVKPIIHPVQIKEYSKMQNYLEMNKKLIIVGYRLNYDDNHINAAIRSFLVDKKDTQLVYLQFGDENEEFIYNQLRLENPTDELRRRIKVVGINAKNCFEEFKKALEE